MNNDVLNEFKEWAAHTWVAIAVALAVGAWYIGETHESLATYMLLATGASAAIAHRLWRSKT